MTSYNQGDCSKVKQEHLDLAIAETQENGMSYANKNSEPEILVENFEPVQEFIQPDAVNLQYPSSPSQLNQPSITQNSAQIQNSNSPQINSPVNYFQYIQSDQQCPKYPNKIPADANSESFIFPHSFNSLQPNTLDISSQNTNQQESRRRWGFLRNLSEHSGMITEKNDRRSFIIKVYTILCCQLFFTAVFVGIVCGVKQLRDGIKNLWPLAVACWAMAVVIMIAIFCTKKYSKKYPYNYLALFLLTLFESYVVAFICAYSKPLIVLFAAVSTLGLTVALTIYAWKTKSDFTTTGGFIIVTLLSFFMFGFWMIWLYSSALYTFYSLIIILLYGYFLVYDTQLIAGGRYQELTYDDYIIGAVLVYIDIIVLFIHILAESGKNYNI